MPPPTQRWIRPSTTANVRIVSASSRSPFGQTVPSAPIEAPRPTGSSAAIWSIAAIFGAPVTEPPGKIAVEHLGQPDVLAQPSLDERDEVHDAGQRARRHQLGQRTEPGSQTRAEVVALEVDDHHVLRGVLLGLGRPVDAPRPRALDRHRPDAPAAAREEELGRCRDDRPAVAVERPRHERASGASAPARAGRVAAERRRQVLDEVHLVDVAGGDRVATASTAAAYSASAHVRSHAPDPKAPPSQADGSSAGGSRTAAGGSGHGSGGAASRPGGARPRGRSRDRRPRRGPRRRPRRSPRTQGVLDFRERAELTMALR